MRTIIAGSRTGFYYGFVEMILTHLWQDQGFDITEVVSGGAKGIDEFGEIWANMEKIPIKKFPAKWKEHGRAAGPIRNAEMADYADALIAFWDGESSGTKSMISEARKRGLLVTVITLQHFESKSPSPR